MKRNCEEMDAMENDMVTDELQEHLSTPKKLKDKEPSQQMLQEIFGNYLAPKQHNFVEREPNPVGYSLVNPNYVNKKSYQELMELENNDVHVSQFVMANMGNKVEQIGQQMKHLSESLAKALQDSARDSKLHRAACNFVKKPGQIYHLYERPLGQSYFSMLSPEDWCGSPPHKFLGSWYLEADQSWTPSEERHSRFEGIAFLGNLQRKSIQ